MEIQPTAPGRCSDVCRLPHPAAEHSRVNHRSIYTYVTSSTGGWGAHGVTHTNRHRSHTFPALCNNTDMHMFISCVVRGGCLQHTQFICRYQTVGLYHCPLSAKHSVTPVTRLSHPKFLFKNAGKPTQKDPTPFTSPGNTAAHTHAHTETGLIRGSTMYTRKQRENQ